MDLVDHGAAVGGQERLPLPRDPVIIPLIKCPYYMGHIIWAIIWPIYVICMSYDLPHNFESLTLVSVKMGLLMESDNKALLL